MCKAILKYMFDANLLVDAESELEALFADI